MRVADLTGAVPLIFRPLKRARGRGIARTPVLRLHPADEDLPAGTPGPGATVLRPLKRAWGSGDGADPGPRERITVMYKPAHPERSFRNIWRVSV